MNQIAGFRLCKLSNEQLRTKIDQLTDEMYQSQTIPVRHIPARPDADYDLLVGELLQRSNEMQAECERLKKLLEDVYMDYVWGVYQAGTDLKSKWLQFAKENNIQIDSSPENQEK